MNEEKKIHIKKKVLSFLVDAAKMLLILLLCAGIGIWLAVGTRAGSSKRYAEEYFKYYASNNYSKMYEMTEGEEDEFINEDHFIYKYESERLYGGVKKYEFREQKKKGGRVTYEVTFTTGNEQTGTLEIVLQKQKKRVYGVFPTWKVNLDNEIAKDCSIGVLAGHGGYIDHVSLENCEKGTSKDGTMDYYFIDRIFKGEHVLTLNRENITSYTFSEVIENSGEQMIIDQSKLELPEKDREEMYTYAKFMLGSLYGYAMDGKTQYDDIAYMFDSGEETQQKARACFDNLRAATVQEDGALLEQISIMDVSVAMAGYTYPSNALIDVAYTYSFVARTGRTTISGVTKQYDGMGTAMAMMRFQQINGTWKVIDISMPCVDYSDKS